MDQKKKDVAFCVDLSCLYNAKSLILEVKILFAKCEYSLMHFTYRVQNIAQSQKGKQLYIYQCECIFKTVLYL